MSNAEKYTGNMRTSKDDFFRDLDSLNDDSESSQRENDTFPLLRRNKTEPVPQVKPLVEDTKSSLQKSKSVTGPVKVAKRQQEPLQAERLHGRKKRRTQSVQVIPESDQIFKGLTFFFIPNNDISPARRLRIQRSQEYGAVWARVWSTDVTHVIVDKDLNYKEVLKVLTSEQLAGNVAIVNQDYVSDYLVFKSALLVTQLRFQVDGIPKAAVEEPETTAHPDDTVKSLSIKGSERQKRHLVTPLPSQDNAARMDVVPEQKEVEGDIQSTSKSNDTDLLDKLISEVKAAGDLPLDENDQEAALELPLVEDPKDDSKSSVAIPSWQKNFACMQRHDTANLADNPNAKTIDTLQKMAQYYEKTADAWRTMAYRKAIAALRKQKSKICTKQEALAIPGIGQRLADKIEEIVSTDRLRQLENTNLTPKDKAIQLFIGVYGAGYAQAAKWVAKGYRSLEDLRDKAELTANQKVGVERYHDFQQRIPRNEVAMHGEVVRSAIHVLDPDMEVIVAGSYRRGATDCGDIDILITKTERTMSYIRTLIMENIVPALMQTGFLKVSLAISSREDGSKWHGACALPGSDTWCRIDLLFVPGAEIGAALIYFTGNDIFNRSLRLLARKKGMRLNQHGLYKDVLRGPNHVKMTDGTLLEGRDEKRIFEILGVPWRPPEHRIC